MFDKKIIEKKNKKQTKEINILIRILNEKRTEYKKIKIKTKNKCDKEGGKNKRKKTE